MSIVERGEYKVELEVFEGPLDLLLYLIKRDEVDIYNIPIERITNQYMEYLGVMRMLDLNIAGEFLVMAATLMLIKSRMLLPEDDRGDDLEDEDEQDPRWDLVRQLVEYKKFKDAAGRLHDRALTQENIFGMGGEPVAMEGGSSEVNLADVNLFDLITAFSSVLKRARPEQIGEIMLERFTVADKIDLILNRARAQESIRFRELFPELATRNEIICTFLALLELIRLRQVRAAQDGSFGEIVVMAGDDLEIDADEAMSGDTPPVEDDPDEEPVFV